MILETHLYRDHRLSQGALVGLVFTARVVREGVSVVLIHDLAFGYHLLHGLFVVSSRWWQPYLAFAFHHVL